VNAVKRQIFPEVANIAVARENFSHWAEIEVEDMRRRRGGPKLEAESRDNLSYEVMLPLLGEKYIVVKFLSDR
jgi:hypothetical protein